MPFTEIRSMPTPFVYFRRIRHGRALGWPLHWEPVMIWFVKQLNTSPKVWLAEKSRS